VDKVFFTGRLDAGQIVMTAAGCRPRPVVLALGGKHPAIVAGDADIDRAARGIAWGALANAGQNFGSIERVYVEERVASRFIARLLEEVDRVRSGAPLDLDVELGPLVSAERRQEVDAQVQEALASGARLLRGGAPAEGPGFFYPPTVLLGPPADSRLMREETLGPVIPIVIVDTLERAILLANDSDYALTASGWTGKAETADRLMVGLQASVVTINDVLYAFDEPGATWAGHRHSGLGHRHGTVGLREMCRQRFVSFDAASSESPLFAFPYDAMTTRLARRAIEFLHGGSRWRRSMGRLGLVASRRVRARMPLGALLFSRRRH
jgi:acyl-CoA reductase-like NAD-dependent aldehyde dehydrogenase